MAVFKLGGVTLEEIEAAGSNGQVLVTDNGKVIATGEGQIGDVLTIRPGPRFTQIAAWQGLPHPSFVNVGQVGNGEPIEFASQILERINDWSSGNVYANNQTLIAYYDPFADQQMLGVYDEASGTMAVLPVTQTLPAARATQQEEN